MSDSNRGAISLGSNVRLEDLRLLPSHCGQYLLIYRGSRIVGIVGSMGGDVEVFELADGGRLTAMELVERL